MRRFLTGFMVAAIVAVVPALALAGNQEIAEQIANRLRNSGQLADYKIGVKYQDGTAWLRGHVTSEEQMQTALRLVFETQCVERIVNDLSVVSADAGQPVGMDANVTPSSYNPLRDSEVAPAAGVNVRASKPQGMAKRLEAAILGPFEKSVPSREEAPARADPVPSSFAAAPVEPTAAAEEPQELPRQLAGPQFARPVARTAREPARVAMQPMTPINSHVLVFISHSFLVFYANKTVPLIDIEFIKVILTRRIRALCSEMAHGQLARRGRGLEISWLKLRSALRRWGVRPRSPEAASQV